MIGVERVSISADGRIVSFYTKAPNLIGQSTTPLNATQAVIRDTCAGASSCTPRTVVVSRTAAGVLADKLNPLGDDETPAISADGKVIAFESNATNLVSPPDTDGVQDIYLSMTGVDPSGGTMPFIASLSPSGIGHGASGFTLVVTGSGFTSDSVASWNGLARTTIFINPTRLFVRIPASDLTAAGAVSVRVCTTAAGCSASATFTVG